MARPAVSMRERFRAAMVLSGVGDAMGYKAGEWEFCHSGETIHQEVKALGGVGKIHVKGEWIVSGERGRRLMMKSGP